MNYIISFSLFPHAQSFNHSFTSTHIATTLCSQTDFVFFTEYLQRAEFLHMTSNQSCMWSKCNKKFKKGKYSLASTCFSLMSVSYHGFCFCGPEMHVNLLVSSEGYLYFGTGWMPISSYLSIIHQFFFSNKLCTNMNYWQALKIWNKTTK